MIELREIFKRYRGIPKLPNELSLMKKDECMNLSLPIIIGKIPVKDIALIYKYRWGIELIFKKIKQNFQLHYFLGETENAIRIQIWCTLIAQLLLTVIQKQINVKRAFSNIVTLVRLHLLSYVDLKGLLNNAALAWRRANPPPILPNLFAT